jgi:polyhydroxyalkanoate synthesis regulator phasin
MSFAGDGEVEALRKRVAELEAKLRANGIEP